MLCCPQHHVYIKSSIRMQSVLKFQNFVQIWDPNECDAILYFSFQLPDFEVYKKLIFLWFLSKGFSCKLSEKL